MIHTGKFLDQYEAEEAKQQNRMLKGMLQQAVKNIEKSNYYAKIKTKLLQAYIKMKPIEFIEVSIISGLTWLVSCICLPTMGLVTSVGFILGFKVPESVIETIRKKRATATQ